MDIGQMRMMLALAESKSMTITAKKLQVTQPALTYQINVIEQDLGFKVFNRSRQGTTLTPEGSFLCDALEKVVSSYDEAVRLSRAMAQGIQSNTVRVGTNQCSRDTVAVFLRLMGNAASELAFTFIPCGLADPFDLLREGVIDFWSASNSVINAQAALEFGFLEMAETRETAYVPPEHRLANRPSIELADLAGETIWLWPRGKVSSAADAMRLELAVAAVPVDIQDFEPDIPAMLAALTEGTIAIYDNGFLPPPSQAAQRIPIDFEQSNQIGLVYRAAERTRLLPVIEGISEQLGFYQAELADGAGMEVGRVASILDDIANTVCRGGMKDIVPLVEYALELGAPANHILDRGVLAGMSVASERFKDGEAYTSEMMAAVATTNLATETLRPLLASMDAAAPVGTAVIGTAVGERHEMGKNLVRIALESQGIEVADLGRQVTPQQFIDHVAGNPSCNLVLISASRTEVLDNVAATVRALEEAGLRERVFVMIGGSAASDDFAAQIGADAFTADATEAANVAVKLLRY